MKSSFTQEIHMNRSPHAEGAVMRAVCLALTSMLLMSAAGCSGASSPVTSPTPVTTPAVAASASVRVPVGATTLGNRAYSPDEITVALGDSVTWINLVSVSHTSTADLGGWNSGTLAPGQQFELTPQSTGTFTYHCAIHPGMVGTVVVQ
jgi:plastocyanin